MKLLRYGAKGQEKPSLFEAEGQIRDLSNHAGDIAGVGLGQKPPGYVKGGEAMRLGIDRLGIDRLGIGRLGIGRLGIGRLGTDRLGIQTQKVVRA